MGHGISTGINRFLHPDEWPKPDSVPTFDPNFGFSQEREVKVMPLSQDEMDSAKIPPEFRDYCVDKYMNFLTCRADNWPLVAKCHHEKHEYHTCEYHLYIDSMKDYERERRLMLRAKRIAAKEASAA